MRDLIGDLTPAPDPLASARAGARPVLRARFYKTVGIEPHGPDGYALTLDGRSVRTPARRVLAVPSEALAGALAAEWDTQNEHVDPARMPLTRLANTIVDGVGGAVDATARDVANYLGSDLLFYRAGEPIGLVAQQAAQWDPVLDWMRERFAARFVLAEGIVFVAQPERSLGAAAAAIPRDPWQLGAVHTITTLTGSAILALAVAHGFLSAEAAWAAANVDEDWNIAQWGADDQALQRRAFRWTEMQAAATVLTRREG